MESTRRPMMIATGLAACLLLAACTPAVSPSFEGVDPFEEPIDPKGAAVEAPQSTAEGSLGAPEPVKGSGAVKVAVLNGQALPASVEDAFHDQTGFTLEQDGVSSVSEISGVGADAVVGMGANDLLAAASALASAPAIDLVPPGTGVEGAASETAYGRDDVCVLADKGWISANKRSLPGGLDLLARADVAQLLAIPDPAHSPLSELFIAGARAKFGEGLGQWAVDLRAGGALVSPAEEANASWTAVDSAQSGAQASRPLLVGPMSAIARTATGAGVEAAARAVEGTCVQRFVYAAPAAGAGNEEGAASFITWLLTWSGQRALAEAGVVYPLDPEAVENTPAHWFLTPSSDALVLDEAAIGDAADAVAQWESAREG